MTCKDALKSDFTPRVKSQLYKSITLGTKTYSIFLNDQRNFFSYPEYSSLRGDLLSYCIEKCIFERSFESDAVFRAIPKVVNNYKRSILHIETDHFVSTLAKTRGKTLLPCKSKYKLKYSQSNDEENKQLSFLEADMKVTEAPYYAVITYGFDYKNNECTHTNLIIPSPRFDAVMYLENLYNRNEEFVTITSDEVEETITKLKPGVLRLLKNNS
nr:MAG TPA: hypothetical protein [Caudoviricetes sp.]